MPKLAPPQRQLALHAGTVFVWEGAMQTARNENGQTLVLTALTMTAMFGFLALALDVGILFKTRRNVQIAADAAATNGALNFYYYSDVARAQAAGRAASKANHFEDGVDGVTVTINAPPLSGPNQSVGNKPNGFVEAIVSKPVSTLFMGTFGSNQLAVMARAVAGAPSYSHNCVWIMSSKARPAFDMRGSAGIDGSGCSIYVNSVDSSAMKTQGNPSFNGTAIDVVGGLSGHGTSPTPVTTGVTAQSPAIPMDLEAPACGTTTGITSVTTSNQATIQALASQYSVICFSGNATLGDGVSLPGSTAGISYVFQKGVTIGSSKSGTVTLGSATQNADGTFSDTQGATIIVSGGTFSQQTGGGKSCGLQVYAPIEGAYNGLALMIPQSNTDASTLTVQWGDTGAIFDGIIYAPKMSVTIQDNGNAIAASGVIADTMTVTASKQFTLLSYSQYNPTSTPLKQISLVE